MILEALINQDGLTKGNIYIATSGRIGYVTITNDTGKRREYPLEVFRFHENQKEKNG